MTGFVFAGSVVYVALQSTLHKAATLRAGQLCKPIGKLGAFASGDWQSISEGKDVFYYSCHAAVSSESTLGTCLQRLTRHGLNQDLQGGAVPGWA